MHPIESKKNGDLCPVCGMPLVIGVLNRAEALAKEAQGFTPPGAIPYKSIIPLQEIIAHALGVSSISKKVKIEYQNMIKSLGSEFDILLDISYDDINNSTKQEIADAIMMVRQGKVEWDPGYDGVFGKIKILNKNKISNQIKLL